ncbi:WD repeat domain-containing protein 83 isoform X2 [Lycorma delicatula]|uniref:WD repeat domain-containing protein 83 isoform X2 n=1 Tax=Lycorma delicatula TaxID=130591 RepID=UPI003F5109EA
MLHILVDGAYCLSCGADKKIKLWNPYRSLLLKTYGGHGSEVLDARGSCDSSQIVSGAADKTVILWDVATGQPLRRLRGHASHVTCVQFNEESTVAISGSRDNTVMCWDMKSRSNEPVQVLREAKDCITSLQVSDEEILTGSLDCKIRRYDIRKGEIVEDFVGDPVTCVNFTRDGQCALVSTTNNLIRLFDKTTGELLNEFVGHKTDDLYIESGVGNNDNHVVSGSVDGSVWWWDLIQAKVTSKLLHDSKRPVHSISIHPLQSYLMSASGATIKLWGKPDEGTEEVVEAS